MKLRKLAASRDAGRTSLGGFVVDYTDALSLYFEYKDIFEKKIYHFTASSREPRIIDAGGCIGMSALYFKSVYPGARLTVFEPDPRLFPLLQGNLERNGITGVTAVNAGLGGSETVMNFYPDGADGGSLQMAHGVEPVPVRIERLSSYIDEPTDLLKMNIEGMEAEVFEEIEGRLPLVREVIFEYHAFDERPQDLHEILALLDRQGFRYMVTDALSSRVPVPFTLPKGYRNFNLVYAVNRKL
jgi:FkbM family methyltransferase